MTTSKTSLITTAIPFVNAEPHLGFAYELVLADIIARHRRRSGRDVRLVCGTDDHSLKNVVAAGAAKLPVHALVDRNAEAFRALGPLLSIDRDDFVQTSRDPRHRRAVTWLWQRCAAAGDLERRTWHGWYCAGCEAFVDDGALCEEHGTPPEPVHEENWFFRLSRYAAPIRDAIESGRLQIVPESARAETLAFLAGEVRDLSVSRDATRARGWGIPVPGDPDQVIYVWFDALANYLTSLSLGGDDPTLLDRFWLRGDERVHVIGKGISRFHTVYWPAFLLSAGLPLPDRILVHGYLTVDGVKISKSRGEPAPVPPVVERVGTDALRWYFARRCRTCVDSDVKLGEIARTYDGDLADRLGNLVQRTTKLAGGRVPKPTDGPESNALLAHARELPVRVGRALDAFTPDEAAAAIVELLDAANRYLEDVAPWRLAKTDPAQAASTVYAPLVAAKIAAAELAPFVPGVSATIAARLGDLTPGAALGFGPPPIPRIA